MKFLITAVPVSPTTRRRAGKAYTVTLDTAHTTDKRLAGVTDPAEVERLVELIAKEHRMDEKVVDVREVR